MKKCREEPAWTNEDLWVDKVWIDENIVYLDEEHYDKYLTQTNGGYGEHPWLVVLGSTAFSSPHPTQTTE